MKILFQIALLLLSTNTFAQSPQQGPGGRERAPITISGTVLDRETGTPLEYATLVLQRIADPSKVTGGITDIDGKFNVETLPGKFKATIEYIGYQTFVLEQSTFNESIDLGTIRLSIAASELEGVELVGEKTTVEVRLDKKIYNIGKDLTTSGATITDALNNVPSVSVDVEGAISLRGNENVRILINGKPSALAGFGSTDALRSLPADAIEKVEVITSPSARYDAEGTAGILNIVLKKEKTLGFNGSLNVNIGYPTSSSASLNSNLRTDKFNIFSTIGIRYYDAPGNAFSDNNYFPVTTTDSIGQTTTTDPRFDRITEERLYNRQGNNFNLNLGMEYFLTETSSITGSFFTRFSKGDDLTENTNQRYMSNALSSRTFREEIEREDEDNFQYSLNYTNNFNDDGHKLTADLQYSRGDETETSYITENETLPTNNLIVRENVLQNEIENEYLAQVDYVLPMGDAQFEAGYRGNFEEEITDYSLDSLNQATGQFVINEDLTNVFTYNENVNALYTQYGNKFNKFSFLLGLRLENTQLKGEVTSDYDLSELEAALGEDVELNFDKNYLGLFPTVNLIFELGEFENISLGYNRRINRPRGRYINPFPSRSSRTNIFQGNPDLDPAFSNSFDLGYLKRWDKLTLTTSVYYQKEDNSFEFIQESTGQTTTDGINIIRSIPINLSTNERIGVEAGALYNPAKWLRLNGSFNYFRFSSEGSFNGQEYGTDNASWFARLSAKVSLPGEIEWQTNGYYRGPRQNAQTKTKGMLSINLAFSKDIMDDKGTLGFNVSDLLNSRKRQSFTQAEDFTSESEFQWRQRSFNLSFVYRFNQPKEKNGRGRGGNGGGGDDDGGDSFGE